LANHSDEEQLSFALARNRVLATCNICDVARVHHDWSAAGRDHAGVILIRQQKWGPRELARRIIRLFTNVPGQDMRNRLEFIGNWQIVRAQWWDGVSVQQ